MEKKEVEAHTVMMYVCPYCESCHEDEEYWAEICRDSCYEVLKKNIIPIK